MDGMKAEFVLVPTGMTAERGKEETVWIKSERIVQGVRSWEEFR